MNPRISTRILLGLLAVLLIAVVGISVPLVFAARRLVFVRTEEKLEEHALQAATRVVDALRTGDDATVVAQCASLASETGMRVTIVDRAGRLVADSGSSGRAGEDFANRPEIREAIGGDLAVQTRPSRDLGTDILVVAAPVAAGGNVYGALRFLRPLGDVRSDQLVATLEVVAIAAMTTLVGTIVALVTSRTIAAPLAEITDVARRMGEGDRAARAEEAGPPEVAGLARTLNAAMVRVDAAAATERAFIANAAHELRTPLTALDLRLDSLSERAGSDQDRRDVEAARRESQHLSRLLSQLLVLARTGHAGEVVLEEALDARPTIQRVAAVWRERLADAGIDLTCSIADPLPRVMLPPELLVQLLENLLDNVARYCPDSDDAELVASAEDGTLVIEVRDHGPGLEPALAERAFERFQRGATSTPGTGLGLAVVREVAEAARGIASLETSTGGTTVSVRLPGVAPTRGGAAGMAEEAIRRR